MKDLNLFANWRDASIDWFLTHARAVTHLADTLVVAEGARAEYLFLVTSGLYGAFTSVPGQPRRELGRLAAGTVFGEMAWLDGSGASASVRAIESSECLAVPVAALNAQLAEDAAFARDFLGALARLLAVRQRASNAALARAGEVGVPSALSALEAAMLRFKELAARLEAASRTREGMPSDAPTELRAAFDPLVSELQLQVDAAEAISPAAADTLGARALSEFLPYLLLTETAKRFYEKPRGYAGDFLTIEYIYERRVGGTTPFGALLDGLLMEQAAPEAVRNRRGVLTRRILAAVGAHGADTRVMSLACGPARELFDAFTALDAARQPRATLLDIDTEALALVGAGLDERGLRDRAQLVQANLIRLALGKEQLEVPPQHLIYSIGLIDYFNDEFVIRLLNWIHDRLAPGGRVILGNFHPRNPVRAFMDHVLQWKLIHRSEADMERLFAATPFGGCEEIEFEAAGVNLFAVGRRRAG